MGLFSDIFFGTSQTNNGSRKNPIGGNFLGDDYEDYYEEIHDDAMCGDLDAQAEMREEFGDDWEGEY